VFPAALFGVVHRRFRLAFGASGVDCAGALGISRAMDRIEIGYSGATVSNAGSIATVGRAFGSEPGRLDLALQQSFLFPRLSRIDLLKTRAASNWRTVLVSWPSDRAVCSSEPPSEGQGSALPVRRVRGVSGRQRDLPASVSGLRQILTKFRSFPWSKSTLAITGPTRRSACDSSFYTRNAIGYLEWQDSCTPLAETNPRRNAQHNSCRRRPRGKSGVHP
jgi:hypothetical protein